MSRRSFLGLAGTALAATALSGCAGTRFSPGGQAHQDDNTITWWSSHPGQSKPAEQELIRRFEKDHPDLTVNLIDAGKNYEECAQKFNAALTGRTVPDIVMLSDVWWFNFALNEQITPIEDVASEVGLD
ncbi:extracellular solute-binding protein, partial [Corallococcus exiguus]|nr:extracellular solute-binding protein [Corallococcus exiguus]